MAITTIFETKVKDVKERLRLDSRVFFEKNGTASTKMLTGSITPAQQRIGNTQKRKTISVTQVVEDDTITGIKIGAVTILGDPSENSVDGFRYGKDVRSIKHLLGEKISFNVTLSREVDITSDNYIDHSFELTSYGQNSLFKTYDYKNERIIPFEDFEGKPLFKSFIGLKDEEKRGYPHVYNAKINYDKFRDPDPASLDGAIEIFPVRNSPANTGFIDLQIKGARGLFGVGNWELTQHTTYGKKGSPFMSEKFEFKQSSYDFFEDANEEILGKPVDGFVSEGLYKSSPFKEDDNFLNTYEHLTITQRKTLLSSSIRNDSEVGTRFKSRDNGFIITPFYQLTEQRSFGTDSIAFSGLLKG